MSDTIVLYHANCPDGFCAAWVAYQSLGKNAQYIPINYGESPPDVKDKRVFILDFSFKLPVMQELIKDAKSLVCLDHHKTAQEELAQLLMDKKQHIVFNMSKSGGMLTWEHFNKSTDPHPWLVDYTMDRDLWLWKLPQSKEVSAALWSYPRDFEMWDVLAYQHVDDIAREGKAILRSQDQMVTAICRNARESEIAGYKILVANTCVLQSEVGEKLAEGRPFGAIWFKRSDGKIQWSLRSRKDGIDVSQVAKIFGGGGHAQAAGFTEDNS